jgi:hypothetical protein
MHFFRSLDSLIRIATGYGLDDKISNHKKAKFFSSPDRICGPPSLLSNRYRGIFIGVKLPVAKLTIHFHLMARSRIVELYLHFLICIHGVALN